MKWFFTLLLVIAAGIGFTLFFRQDSGFIVVSHGHWTLETSLAFFIISLTAALLTIYLALKLLLWFGHLPYQVHARHWARRQRKSHQMLQEGMLALWREQWQVAESLLVKSAFHSAMPVLHHLGAAFATLHLPPTPENQVRVADYFDQARPESAIRSEELLLFQAHAQKQINPAAALQSALRAYEVAPTQPEILHTLLRLYQQNGQWKEALLLLPEVKKYNALSAEEFAQIEIQLEQQRLRQLCEKSAVAGKNYWAQLSKSLRLQPELVIEYTQYLVSEGAAGQAEILLRETLEQQWHSELINAYGQLRTIKPSEQIHHAEKWLKTRFNDVDLLLALGRLSMREKLWDKAEQYLKAALNQMPANQSVNPAIYQMLGETFAQQGEWMTACEYYRQAVGN